MPELPEVETTMRGLEPAMKGLIIERVLLRRAGLRLPFPENFQAGLEGRRVRTLQRRGKYILVFTEGGAGFSLHLGMSGRMLIVPPGQGYEPARHDHVVFDMQGGGRIVFNDARRFGMLFLVDQDNWSEHAAFHSMGPEPLAREFSGRALHERLRGRRTPLKTALLDQRIVAGIGNIYASEALYDAALDPFRPAADIDAKEASALAASVQKVLRRAIEAGGSSLKDYRHADGNLGYFQHHFSVYDRAGALCPACLKSGRTEGCIEKTVQAGRSTFFCPHVQKTASRS